MRRVWMVWFLAGCMTPYQETGFRGGYSDQELSPGVYSIDVRANAFTSRGTVLAYMYRRADELCPGGYSVVDGTSGSNQSLVYVGDRPQILNKPEGGIVVRCNSPQAAAAAPPARVDRAIVEGRQPVSCLISNDDPAVGMCFFDAGQCEASYARHRAEYRPCVVVAAASCFVATRVLARRQTMVCAPTIANCEAKRAQSASDPDLENVSDRCGIYRTQGAS
ncbi:MAG TPA: hypothetical protein VFP84_34195 [Kofleriaceae bacterium]|nr:hypothetical protein [Kofleriaceae bacterium]